MIGTAIRTAEITIGMPVYNGEAHLQQAIDSLLAQSFRDFVLLISDNASTDRTQQLCEDYARCDPRVRYFRQSSNRGATFNWNFVVLQSDSPFFKWASANDVCPPTMLEHCLQVLRQQPEIALCYGRTELIDDHGASIGIHDHDPEVLDKQPSVRYQRILEELAWNNAQSGLIRSTALRRTRLERDYIDGDMVLMAELALLGGFRKLDEIFLQRRTSRGTATKFMTDAERQRFLVPNATRRAPLLRRHLDRIATVCRAPIGWREKRHALNFTLRSIYWDRHNVANAVAKALRSTSTLDRPHEGR